MNAQQRLLGEHLGANVDDDGYVDVEYGGSVHLDDERDEHLHDKEDIHTGETSTRVDDDHVMHHEVESIAVDPKERSFLPNWNLLLSNDSLFTQSPCQAPLHQPLDRQQLPLAHQQVPVAHSTFIDPMERSFFPNWNLIPSNDSFFMCTDVPKSPLLNQQQPPT